MLLIPQPPNTKVIHNPHSHAFFPKKRGLAEKRAVSLLFCSFLRIFALKKAPFPCFRIFYPRFFRQNCTFFEPPHALVTAKKSEGRNDTKKAQETKKAQKGGSGNATWCCPKSCAVLLGKLWSATWAMWALWDQSWKALKMSFPGLSALGVRKVQKQSRRRVKIVMTKFRRIRTVAMGPVQFSWLAEIRSLNRDFGNN